MSFWVNLLWWVLAYADLSGRAGFSATRWLVACAGALYTAMLLILSSYYAYTGAFGVEILAVDVLILLLGVTVSQLLALHLVRYVTERKSFRAVSLAAILILAAAFILFTFAPPRVPMFMDPQTGLYGIRRSIDG
jgi:hypothetical protein